MSVKTAILTDCRDLIRTLISDRNCMSDQEFVTQFNSLCDEQSRQALISDLRREEKLENLRMKRAGLVLDEHRNNLYKIAKSTTFLKEKIAPTNVFKKKEEQPVQKKSAPPGPIAVHILQIDSSTTQKAVNAPHSYNVVTQNTTQESGRKAINMMSPMRNNETIIKKSINTSHFQHNEEDILDQSSSHDEVNNNINVIGKDLHLKPSNKIYFSPKRG